MKRVLTFVLVMVMSLAISLSASAATVNTENGTDSAAVKATYVPSPDVYSVEITWGALTYTYTQTWHTDTRTNTYAWASTQAGVADKITLANSSNVAVEAVLTWNEDASIKGVEGAFLNDKLTMDAPEEGAEATTADTTLTLSGTPTTTNLNNTTVGTITIKIAKANP